MEKTQLIKNNFRGERGLTLIESLVTVGIMGIAVVAFTTALSTGSLAVAENDVETAAQSLARSQMEYIKGYPYDADATTYPTVNTTGNYGITVAVASVAGTDANIQKVTANITKDGAVMLTVSDYKVNR